MKGSNSRFSHRPGRRYSNAANIQGGMVTDADLTEAGQLHQARDEAQNDVTIGSGSPARDGIVRFGDDGLTLQQGWVVAEGKQGRLVAASGDAALSGAALFKTQADVPDGPELPDGTVLLYADLWERPVFALQDPYLADAGLHGAETSYRTRTMVQIKALPLDGTMTLDKAMTDLNDGVGVFRRKGNALVTVKAKNTEITVDACDPCADQVDIVPSVPNALFRIEVTEVARDDQGKAISARLAWSMENAAAIETTARLKDAATGPAMKAAFARDGAVYQYFSDATEARIGIFPPGVDPAGSEFATTLTDRPFSHVRRWDGAAVVDVTNSTVPADSQMGLGKMTAAAGKALLTVDLFTLEIDYNGRALIAGDYWLIELRRFAPEAERVRLVGTTDNANGLPVGIEHHFCALFISENGKGSVASDTERRRLSFPALTDIPASHVSFAPDCPAFFDSAGNVADALNALCDLDASQVGFAPECPAFFDDAENVADALNALCDLDASQVAFDPGDGCERFAGTRTVDEALKKLCTVQDDTMLTRLLRTMMDWGVVCGIRLRQTEPGSTRITWSAGTLLDRQGRLIEVKAGLADLREVPDDHYQGKLQDILSDDGEVCLSMAAGADGSVEFYFTDRETAFGKFELTFDETVDACIKGRKWIVFDKVTRPLAASETNVVKKMVNVWANRKTLDGRVAMTLEEQKVASAVNKTLAEEYLSGAEPERADEIKRLLAQAEAEIVPEAVQGTARDVRRMQLEAAKLGIIAAAEREDELFCQCFSAFPFCPSKEGAFTHLVPVACVRPLRPKQGIHLGIELCEFCCRKQAMTWRSYRYYQGSFIDDYLKDAKAMCCRPAEQQPGGKWRDWIEAINDIGVRRPVLDTVPEPEPELLWPPIKQPGGGLRDLGRGMADMGKYIRLRPDIATLSATEATNVLTGNGYDVLEVLDLDGSSDPLGKLGELGFQGDSVLGREAPEPGDKVVMLASGGKALDFVVVRKGSGKLPFETEADTTARVTKILAALDPGKTVRSVPPVVTETPPVLADLDAFAERLKGLSEERSKAEAELDRLAGLRTRLAADVGGLQAVMTEMAELKTRLAADVERSRADLRQISDLKEASLADIAKATAEMAEMRKSQEEFVLRMRREQPVESILGTNTDVIEALKARGLVTVGDIEKANDRSLTAIMGRTGMDSATLRRLVAGFIER